MPARTRRISRTESNEPPKWRLLAGVGLGVAYAGGIVGTGAFSMAVNIGVGIALALLTAGALLSESESESDGRLEFGTGMILVAAAFGVARYLEFLHLSAYPLVYLAVAFIVTFQSRKSGLGTVGFALVLLAAAHVFGTAPGLGESRLGFEVAEPVPWTLFGMRAAFLAGFGLFAYLIHGAEETRRRSRREREVEQQREDLLRRAREFRLLNAGRSGSERKQRSDVEEFAVMDAVEAVERGIYEKLSLLHTSLDCYTCVLLWFDVGRESLYIKELVSDSDDLVEHGLDPAQGVLGSIVRCREPVNLDDLRRGFRGLSYYRGAEPVTDFLGVPLIEEGHLRGIMCVDRVENRPFSEQESAVVEMICASILRSIENERIFKNVEATKFELGQFFSASRRLNSVLSMGEVLEAAIDSAADVVPYEFAAVTLCETGGSRHRIATVDAVEEFEVDVDDWQERTFEPNAGLVSMAVKNRHYLPFGGKLRDGETVVFTRAEDLSALRSLLVLPLIVRDEAIGTLVVGTRDEGGVSTERREMLEVIANQVAVSLQNARLYARMETLATTDDLTGLPNRRTFDRKLDEAIARHERADRCFGLLLLDIDHFKAVNDTHGHPVGDEVLRQVSDVLQESVREIDVPARYGGEEFAVILEESGLEEANHVAERIRTEVAKLEFAADGRSFQCTVSLGIAIWPSDVSSPDEILDAADEALYASKESGRNRVTAWCDLR